MDYHVCNIEDYPDKPMVFWTKGDMLNYVAYLDQYIDALKRDYETIVQYQEVQEQTVMTPQQKEIITHAVVDWAHDRNEIMEDSENVAFPFASDVAKAELNEEKIAKAIDVANTILTNLNIESESGQMKETEKEREKEKIPFASIFEDVKGIALYGLIGLGLWIGYKVFTEFRR